MKKITRIQTGFTLIELIVVLLILSALAVTAYARMTHIDALARQAALQSFKASVLATATMARGVCMADAQCSDQLPAPSATIEGHTIYFNHGYPVGWLGNADGAGTLQQLLDPGKLTIQAALSDSNRAVYYFDGAKDSSHCKLEYVIAATGPNAGLTVTTDHSGC